jgi:hypothetical protein
MVIMQPSPNGTTTPTPGIYNFTLGGSVAFMATPNAGYNFVYWLINGVTNTTNPVTLTIDSNLEMVPVFTQKVEPTPMPSSYTITLQSSVNGTTTPPPGIYSRTVGDTLTLTATPNTNYKFDYWLINGVTNSTNPLTLAVTSDTKVEPTFTLVISPPVEPAATPQENQTSTTPPEKTLTIALLSPTAGEKWQAGTTCKIEWNASGGTKPLRIALEYASSSSSGDWTMIAENLANNGSVAWRVPIALTTCYIRASVTDTATEPQSATAQVEIEISPVAREFQAFLAAAMLLPFVAIAVFFLKRENASTKSTTVLTKSLVSKKASNELSTE